MILKTSPGEHFTQKVLILLHEPPTPVKKQLEFLLSYRTTILVLRMKPEVNPIRKSGVSIVLSHHSVSDLGQSGGQMDRVPDPELTRLPLWAGLRWDRTAETPLYLVGLTFGFFLSTRTVVLHDNKHPSNFFTGVGGPCKNINTFCVKCSLGDSESVEHTMYVLLITV